LIDFQKAVSELRGCQLFVFDFDGTLYGETEHFAYYGEVMASFLPETKRAEFRAQVAQALAHNHAISYGTSYHVGTGELYDQNRVEELEAIVLAEGSSQVVHVDDPWGVYGAIGIHHGLAPQSIHEAFLRTREHMLTEGFPMQSLPGLVEALEELKAAGRTLILMTNSPQEDGLALLNKLGYSHVFSEMVFSAAKPEGVVERFERWSEQYQVPLPDMVSIGDHYRNEIHPLLTLGIKTIYIDSYIRMPREGVTLSLGEPEQLGRLFAEVAKLPGSFDKQAEQVAES